MTAQTLGDAVEETLFGGKAASLARAIRARLPVPPGFALSWDLVANVVAGDPESVSLALRLFHDAGGAVSVRSSAIGEDSVGASFAGQHLTVLNVVSDQQFLEAIAAVHASADTEAAAEYRDRLAVRGQARIAIVVQRMINSDSAGVLFTRNPLSGADERVIEASWGLGEAVVAGLVTPDMYRVARTAAIVERIPGLKDLEIRFGAEGTVELGVDTQRARQLCLDDGQLVRLHELALLCERVYGNEIDLEWAFEGNELYLLQSRPITAVGRPTVDVASANTTSEHRTITTRRLIGFALAALLSPLNSTMIAVALPEIGQSFKASGATLTLWLVSIYLLVSIVAQSPSGKLGDLLGYSRILTAGRILFALGAIAGALAPSLAVLAIARVAMAIGGAFNIPAVMAQLRNDVPAEERGRVFGMFGAIMGGAAAVGPLIGGVLMKQFGWHSLFLVNLPIILLSLVLEPLSRNESRRPGALRFDVAGTILFSIAISLLVGGIQLKAGAGWIAVAAGAVAMFAFIVYEKRVDEPLLDLRLFSSHAFSAGSVIVALQNFSMYAVLFLVPFLFAQQIGANGSIGFFLLAMTGAMLVTSLLGGRASDTFGARSVTMVGAAIGTLGAVLLFAMGTSGTAALVASLVLLGSGLGLSTSPSQAAAMSGIAPTQAGAAAGALSTMRYLGGVFGSGVVGLVIATASPVSPLVWIFPTSLGLSALVARYLPARAEARQTS